MVIDILKRPFVPFERNVFLVDRCMKVNRKYVLHVIGEHTCVCLVKREGEREVASTKVALYRKTIRTFAPVSWHVRIRLTPLTVSLACIFGCSPLIVSFAPVRNDVQT